MNLFVFGDSIAAGTGASVPAKCWASLTATALGAALTNYGKSTAMAIDMSSSLFGCAPGAGDVSAVMFGTNDEAKYDVDPAKRGFYIDCLRAYAVRLASGFVNATPANGVTFTGSWGAGYAFGTYASAAAGSKATFSVTGNSVALGFLRQYNNSGTFQVVIDGVNKGTFAIGGDVRTILGAAYGPMCLAFTGLGAGAHTVELTVLTADVSNVVFFQWFSAMQPKNKVVLVNIPHAVAYTYGGSSANVDNYNIDIAALVASLAGMGLPVSLADICSVLLPSDMYDNVHPNDSGHQKISSAVLTAQNGGVPFLTFTPTTIFLGSDGNFYAGTIASPTKLSTS